MKQIHYNEYGAPIEQNPKWCDWVWWTLYKISSFFYPKHMRVYMWFQCQAYPWGDLQCYTKIKGYKL